MGSRYHRNWSKGTGHNFCLTLLIQTVEGFDCCSTPIKLARRLHKCLIAPPDACFSLFRAYSVRCIYRRGVLTNTVYTSDWKARDPNILSNIMVSHPHALQEHGAALLSRCESASALAAVEVSVKAAIGSWHRSSSQDPDGKVCAQGLGTRV